MSPQSGSLVLQQALTYLKNGDAAGADILMTSFLARSPDDADGQNVAGLIKQHLGELDAAADHLRHATELAPDEAIYHTNLGAVFAQRADFADAAQAFERAFQIAPDRPEVIRNLADTYLKLRRFEEARLLIGSFLDSHPNSADLEIAISFALQGLGDLPEAIEHAKKASELDPGSAASARCLGIAYLKSDDPSKGAKVLRHATELDPQNIEGWANLGVALKRIGDLESAEVAFRRALSLSPNDPGLRNNLGNILASTKRYQEAEETFRGILSAAPGRPDVSKNLALVLQDMGRLEEAIDVLDAGLNSNPNNPILLSTKGNTLRMMEQYDDAEQVLRAAIEADPKHAEAHNNHGLALSILNRMEDSEQAFLNAIALRPSEAVLHNNLGALQIRMFKLDDAAKSLARALELDPDYVDAMRNYGTVKYLVGEVDEAKLALRRVLDLKPDDVPSLQSLAVALWEEQSLEEAEALVTQALEIEPTYSMGQNLLGVIRVDQRRIDEALTAFSVACESHTVSAPTYASNRLFSSLYAADRSNETIFNDHLDWGRRFATDTPDTRFPHAHAREPDRKLRVGYVSPDFRGHSVAYFFEPIIEKHDRAQFEVFCYSNTVRTDKVTTEIRKAADGWVETAGMSDQAMLERIRDDQVDILVNLGGHTAGNRMPVLARKPSPVQLEYLGYPDTSGVPAMDVRLTDRHADPEGVADQWATERLVRLSSCFHCYRPHGKAPDPAPPPFETAGHVTFGSFNVLPKVTDKVVGAWADILRSVPTARLLVKCKQLNSESVKESFAKQFERRGIDPSRLTLLGFLPSVQEHLNTYGKIDLGLDTFPYNGTTTTCEALWMGVPVLTHLANRHSGRVGLSLLAAVGVEDVFVAQSTDDYVEKAVRLANNPDQLAPYRAELRDRMKASPLRKEEQFVSELEGAYRTLWHEWCAGPPTFEYMKPKALKPDDSVQGLLAKTL